MRYFPKFKNLFFTLLLIIGTYGCASYYEKNIKLQEFISNGNLEQANQILDKSKKKETEGINRMLYWCNRGTVSFMQGEYEVSNSYFNKADLYVEDYKKKLGNEALSLISNPMVKPYKPEDFEAVMVHYYKALNYINLNDYQGALVEARRVNIVLNKFNEKYKQNKNKYSRDAFSHLLMGVVYEASGNINDAFIAYRNAYDVYEQDYKKLFGVSAPLQLKKDIIRTAGKLGFGTELDFYERKFGLKFKEENHKNGDLVFFWMNGFGPIKDEWSINFANAGTNNGMLLLENAEYGISFPIFIGNQSGRNQAALKNMSMLRIAFPKYVERKPVFYQAQLNVQGKNYPLELSQDVNKIAFQCLKDRMVREIANSILRLATKKALEAAVNNQDELLGALVSIANAVTEKADTRNWQSLPYSISYSRVSLPEGVHKVNLEATGKATSTNSFDIQIRKGKTSFYTFHHLENAGFY